MASNIPDTKTDLHAIFPQHSEEVITRIYNNAVESIGEDSHILILPMCIEQLLELPASKQETDTNDISTNNLNNFGEYSNTFNGNIQPEVFSFKKKHLIPGLHDGDSSDSTSSSEDELLQGHEYYRNKPKPNYREIHDRFSISPKSSSKSPDLFSDTDDSIFTSSELNDVEELGYKRHSIASNNAIIIHDPPLQTQSRKRKLIDVNKDDISSYILNVVRNNIEGQPLVVNGKSRKSSSNIGQSSVNMIDISKDDSSLINPVKNAIVTIKSTNTLTPPVINGRYYNPGLWNSPSTVTQPTFVSTTKCNKTESSLNISQPIVSEKIDISTITKGMVGYLEIAKEHIMAIIEDIDNTYLENIINEQSEYLPIPQLVNSVVEYLLDNKGYPKVGKNQPHPYTSPTFQSSATITSSMDSFKYNQQSIMLLQNDFHKIPTKVLRNVFCSVGNNYTKAFRQLETVLDEIITGKQKVELTIIKSFLKGTRNKIVINPDLSSSLQSEILEIEKKMKEDLEKGDLATAVALNTKQYDEEGQTIECGCCYDEVAFEDMVQCLEGHLFCANCLRNYSKEAIYGTGKLQLFCMTSECDSTFPFSQLKKALVGNMMEKYMERVQDEDIKLANIDNLIRCPGCEFAAEMDDGDKVFRCQNSSCMKESCRYCKEDWKDHFGVPCKEVEKKGATNLRTTYEEKMTQAKVRTCWRCSTIFLKSEGCNKMTCRCGAKMCYVCRKPKINYEHFCQHPREPGRGCDVCKKCNLWTDPSEDDDRAVAEIKKQAEEERTKFAEDDGQTVKISIGPEASSSVNKKIYKHDGHHHGYHQIRRPPPWNHNRLHYPDPGPPPNDNDNRWIQHQRHAVHFQDYQNYN